MTKQTNIDPTRYLEEAFRNAEQRGSFMLAAPSFLSDEDWKEVTEIAHTYWPDPKKVTDAQKLEFMHRHNIAVRQHFLSFVFELERLYSLINWMKP